MRISDTLVIQLLKNADLLTSEQFESLKKREQEEKKPLQDLVIDAGVISEQDLTRLYAEKIDIPFISLSSQSIPPEIIKRLPERIARRHKAVVFGLDSGQLQVAVADPRNSASVDFLHKQLGSNLAIHIATMTDIESALEHYQHESRNLPRVVAESNTQETNDGVQSAESLAIQTTTVLLAHAAKMQASDIHVEPRENYVLVRYRIDGVLREINKLPRAVLTPLTIQIKKLANLIIEERRVPQDGHFNVDVAGQLYAIHVSTLPVLDGENIAMHIINQSATAPSLEELGLWGINLDKVQNAITQPHGSIIVCGPNGAGKSTSLFSMLSLLSKPGISIATVEDPIEHRIPGASQTPVNTQSGMTFSSGLQAVLRHDPDLVMVGEIHDNQTAQLVAQAAQKGHLVFAGMHTTNASAGISRLLEMNVEPFLIASTLRLAIGQRLVRKLCVGCRQKYSPSKEVLSKLTYSSQTINRLEKEAMACSLGGDDAAKELGSTRESINTLWKSNPKGCDQCEGTGYNGRIGIFEAISGTDALSKLIATNSTLEKIQKQAITDGTVSMQTDGIVKALRGLIDIVEVANL